MKSALPLTACLWLLTSAGAAGLSGSGLSAVDRALIPKVIMGNRFELLASKLALRLSRDHQTRAYAQSMITVHTERLATLRATVLRIDPSVTFPSNLTPDQQSILTALGGAGNNFDNLYKQAMKEVHAQAFGLFQTYTSSAAAHPALKALLQDVLATVKQHWDQASDLPGQHP